MSRQTPGALTACLGAVPIVSPLGCCPHWLWLSCNLARAIPFARGRASYRRFPNNLQGKALVYTVPNLDAINLRGSGCNIDLFFSQRSLHHSCVVRGTSLEIYTVGVLRFADLSSSIKGGFVIFS